MDRDRSKNAIIGINEEKAVNVSEQREDGMVYKVVVNHEEQYSILLAYRECPKGWKDVGKSGIKSKCMEYINEVWTDMRPLSLRKKMDEMKESRPEVKEERVQRIKKKREKTKDSHDNLVKYLSEGAHPVEVGLRPDRTVKIFKETIDRGYVHIKFTDTMGGTELRTSLDAVACDFANADFENRTGEVHLEGDIHINYVRARCVANIDISTLTGTGHLEHLSDEKS